MASWTLHETLHDHLFIGPYKQMTNAEKTWPCLQTAVPDMLEPPQSG